MPMLVSAFFQFMIIQGNNKFEKMSEKTEFFLTKNVN
jgi:hypothetical protein